MDFTQQLLRHPELYQIANLIFSDSELFQLYQVITTPDSEATWQNQNTIRFPDKSAFLEVIADRCFPKRFGFNSKCDKKMEFKLIHPRLKRSSSRDDWLDVWVQWMGKEYTKKDHFMVKLFQFIEGASKDTIQWNKQGDRLLIKNLAGLKQSVIKDAKYKKNDKMITRSLKISFAHYLFQHKIDEQNNSCELSHTFLTRQSSMKMWILSILIRRQELSHIWKEQDQTKKKAHEQKQRLEIQAEREKKKEALRRNGQGEADPEDSGEFQIGSLSSEQKDEEESESYEQEPKEEEEEQSDAQSENQRKNRSRPAQKQIKKSHIQLAREANSELKEVCDEIQDSTRRLYEEINRIKTKLGIAEIRTFVQMSVICSEITLETDRMKCFLRKRPGEV